MTENDVVAFRRKFDFVRHSPGRVSVRRQHFLIKLEEGVVERGEEFLTEIRLIWPNRQFESVWGLGLTYFQLNHRTPFVLRGELERELTIGDDVGNLALRNLGLRFSHEALGEIELPPHFLPTPAYTRLAKRYDRSLLTYLVRTCSICLDISMPDHETALRAMNALRPHVMRFADKSGSQRKPVWLYITRRTGIQPLPRIFRDWEDYALEAHRLNFADDPRNCPHVMSISAEGTLRLDFFGSIRSVSGVLEQVAEVMEYVNPVLASRD